MDSNKVALAYTGRYSKGAVLRCPVRDHLLGCLHRGTEGGRDEVLVPTCAHEQTTGMGWVEEPESSQ
jgi:hypothetical protein